MSWSDDWLTAGYTFRGDDFDALYKAALERVRVGGLLVNWNNVLNSMGLGGLCPDGLNPPTPPKTPVDYQDARIYSMLQQTIVALLEGGIGAGGATILPAVVRKGAPLDGAPIANLPGGPAKGWLQVVAGAWAETPVVYRTVGEMRVDAGLADFTGLPEYTDHGQSAFRRRCPRSIDSPRTDPAHPYTSAPTDTEGNTVDDGMYAWERSGQDTGRLLLYDGVAKVWKYSGQGQGQMPDMLDTDAAAPNHAAMGVHREGDYIDQDLLDELKQLLKIVTRFTYTLAQVNAEWAFGQSDLFTQPATYAGARAEAEAAYDAVAASPAPGVGSGGVGQNSRAWASEHPDLSITYGAALYTGRAQYRSAADRTVNRDVDFYLVAYDSGFPAGEAYAFDGNPPPALLRSQAVKVETQANPAATFTSAFHPADYSPRPDYPIGGGTPASPTVPNTMNGYNAGYQILAGFWVADYDVAGGFAYT